MVSWVPKEGQCNFRFRILFKPLGGEVGGPGRLGLWARGLLPPALSHSHLLHVPLHRLTQKGR